MVVSESVGVVFESVGVVSVGTGLCLSWGGSILGGLADCAS